MAQEGRSILAYIFRTFIQSLKPRQIRGNLIGTDYFGNKYFEIPACPERGKRKPSRWFQPKSEEDFDQELPAEWEAWLRGRRTEPPKEEELMKNLAIMKQKKENAEEIERKRKESLVGEKPVLEKEVKGAESFPKYKEYEIMPGKKQDEV